MYGKKFLLALVGCWLSCSLAAQTQLDSLQAVLDTNPSGKDRVGTLVEAGYAAYLLDFQQAMDYAAEAVQLAEDLEYRKGLGEANRLYAVLYQRAGLFQESMRHALTALDEFEAIADSGGIAAAHTNVGAIHYYLRQPDQAREYYEKALRMHEAMRNRVGIVSVRNNLATMHTISGDFDTALRIYHENLDSLKTMDAGRLQAGTRNNIGGTLNMLGQRREAVPYLIAAGEAYEKIGDKVNLSGCLTNLASAYIDIGQLSKAKAALDRAEGIARGGVAPARMAEIYQMRAHYHQEAGSYKSAFRFLQLHQHLQDSIDRAKQGEKALQLKTAYDGERRLSDLLKEKEMQQAELDMQAAELSREGTVRNALIGGFALVLLFSVILIRQNQTRRKAYRLLGRQKREIENKNEELETARQEILRMNNTLRDHNVNLEQQVSERTQELETAVQDLSVAHENLDTFIYRASHDLRGPIARMKGLAQLAVGASEGPVSNYVELMNVSADRMDRVLRKLIMVRGLSKDALQPEEIDPKALIGHIRQQLMLYPEVGELNLQLSGDLEKALHADRIRMEIILQNLIENAYYFRKDTDKTAADIHIEWQNNGRGMELMVEDHGIGIDPLFRAQVFDLFFRGNPQSVGNGVGLYLVKQAVDRLGGKIGIESEEGAFTRMYVKIPWAG